MFIKQPWIRSDKIPMIRDDRDIIILSRIY